MIHTQALNAAGVKSVRLGGISRNGFEDTVETFMWIKENEKYREKKKIEISLFNYAKQSRRQFNTL